MRKLGVIDNITCAQLGSFRCRYLISKYLNMRVDLTSEEYSYTCDNNSDLGLILIIAELSSEARFVETLTTALTLSHAVDKV